MEQIKNSEDWAKEVFGKAELGDKRLTKRLVSLSSQLSEHTGKVSLKVVKAVSELRSKLENLQAPAHG